MMRFLHSARPRLLAALALIPLAACSDGGTLSDPTATVEIISPNPHAGVAGEPLPNPVTVRVVDGTGVGVAGVAVRFAASGRSGEFTPASATTDADGVARAVWVLSTAEGEQTATVRAAGANPVTLRARAIRVSPLLASMLPGLGDYQAATLDATQRLLPLNPGLASYIEEKIAVLRNPALASEVIEGRRFAEGSAPAGGGARIPVAVVFAQENMRVDAAAAVREIETTLPVVAEFLGLRYPETGVKIWYGFGLGSSGGAGVVRVEDRATYDARTATNRLMPHGAILVHEMTHSYLGHESLNQFLELYGYNVSRSGSADVATWSATRRYVAGLDGNTGVHALLDVYGLIGRDAMANAYRALIPMRPPYGQAVPPAVQQLFVDAAPPALRATVAAKMAKVGF